MASPQPGILLPVPPRARYLTFSLQPGLNPRGTLRKLAALADGNHLVAGFGESLVLALGRRIEGLRAFPSGTGAVFDIPSTQSALWIWARGEDRGELFHRSRHVERSAFLVPGAAARIPRSRPARPVRTTWFDGRP